MKKDNQLEEVSREGETRDTLIKGKWGEGMGGVLR